MSFLKVWLSRIKAAKWCWNRRGMPSSITYRKYPPKSDFGGRKVLNLGCGATTYKAENVINLDAFKGKDVDEVCDLSKGKLNYKDGEFDLIIANHVFEHIPNWWGCFKECARVLKVGGVLEIWVPCDGGSSQLGYRDHINVINHCSFVGIRNTFRNQANLWEKEEQGKMDHVKDLEMVDDEIIQLPWVWWVQLLPNRVQNFGVKHLRNFYLEVGWKLVKKEPLGSMNEYFVKGAELNGRYPAII